MYFSPMFKTGQETTDTFVF